MTIANLQNYRYINKYKKNKKDHNWLHHESNKCNEINTINN